jgi:hypothetical protein
MIFDTKEIVIGGTEWKTAPFRFNRMFTLGAKEQGILPSDYTQLEYIESTGTQWINTQTEIIPNKYDTIIDLTMGKCTNLINSENGIFGLCRYTGSSWLNYAGARWKTVTTLRGAWGTKYKDNTVTQQDINYLHIEKDNTTFNGDLLNNFPFDSSYDIPQSIFLFATTPQNGKTSAIRIYYCKISNTDGKVLRELIPARRKSDNELGLYDTVKGIFLTNDGTGTFITADS